MQSNYSQIMKSLFIYIVVFTLIICIVGIITNYFYGNIKNLNKQTSINSEYTRLNLYLLKTTKTKDIKIKKYGLVNEEDLNSYYITFENEDGTTNTFIKKNDIIYFNQIKLCKNVDEFKVIIDKASKESISVEVKIQDKIYNLQYVLN